MKYDRFSMGDRTFYILRNAIIISVFGLAIIPFILITSVTFMSPSEFFGDPHLIPRNPTLSTWMVAWTDISDNMFNSVVIASGTAILSMAITIPGAYAFARNEFYGKKLGFYLIILTMLFPYIILIIPIMDLWRQLGIYNTFVGLWLGYQSFVTPFALWILRDFFQRLPSNIEEAAQVYGCTQFSAFTRVILPLAAPGIIAVGFLAFLTGWNDFLFSNLLTNSQGPMPAVPVLWGTVVGGSGGERTFWGKLMAQTIIIGVPPTVLYIFARRYLEQAFAI